jgi:hypothetical protein
VLKTGGGMSAVIEQGLESILHEQNKRDGWLEIEIMDIKHECWMDLFSEFQDQLKKVNVPDESCVIMLKTLTSLFERNNRLYTQVIAEK